jgi:hypothetical protein
LLASLSAAGAATVRHPLCCGGQGTTWQPDLSAAGLPARPQASQAAVLTSFVQVTLAPAGFHLAIALRSTGADVLAQQAGDDALSAVRAALLQRALLLTWDSVAIASLPPPPLSPLPTLQMTRLLEDLTLCTAQVAGVLQETAAALPLSASPLLQPTSPAAADVPLSASTLGQGSDETGMAAATVSDVLHGVASRPRLHQALSLCHRAEAWLDTIDHETGAYVTLPGFEVGAPSLESQFALH